MASAIGRPPVQVINGKKPCSRCKECRPVSDFTRDSQAKTGLSSDCKSCRRPRIAATVKRWGDNHPDRLHESNVSAGLKYYHSKGWLRKLAEKHGVTPEQHAAMLKAQNGVCAICGEVDSKGYRLSVDHDHETGRVRGLLCGHCNTALGSFKESPALLHAAARYICLGGPHNG